MRSPGFRLSAHTENDQPMTKCPFCRTSLDDQAVICPGCKARKGYGYHSAYGVLTRERLEKRFVKFRLAAAGITALALVAAFVAQGQETELTGRIIASAIILTIGFLAAAVPLAGMWVWKRRMSKGPSWWN